MNKSRLLGALCAAVLLASSISANASLMLDVNSNSGVGYVCGSCTFGYDFTLDSAVTIKAMGIFDYNADGLINSHQVGLWDSGGNLLASTTISNSSVAVASSLTGSQWLFEDVTDVTLNAGQYFVGMTQPSTGGQDLEVRGPVTFNLPGTKGVGRYGGFNGGGLTLAFPGSASNSDGFFGPNLSTTSVSAVPVPAAVWLFGSGLLGMVGIARRKKA